MKKIIFSTLLAISFCACTKETINYQNPVPGENGTEANTVLSVRRIEKHSFHGPGWDKRRHSVQEPWRKGCSQCQHECRLDIRG